MVPVLSLAVLHTELVIDMIHLHLLLQFDNGQIILFELCQCISTNANIILKPIQENVAVESVKGSTIRGNHL